MNKFLNFAFKVVGYFAVSLMFNWIFSDPEPIGEMLITSILFGLISSAIHHFAGKEKSES